MKKVLILSALMFNLVFGLSNNKLLNPETNIYDFTFNSVEGNTEVFEPEKNVPQIELEVEKILGLIPRTFVYDECKNDPFSNKYCPIALAKAAEYWSYDNGVSVKKTAYVKDYTSKENQILVTNAVPTGLKVRYYSTWYTSADSGASHDYSYYDKNWTESNEVETSAYTRWDVPNVAYLRVFNGELQARIKTTTSSGSWNSNVSYTEWANPSSEVSVSTYVVSSGENGDTIAETYLRIFNGELQVRTKTTAPGRWSNIVSYSEWQSPTQQLDLNLVGYDKDWMGVKFVHHIISDSDTNGTAYTVLNLITSCPSEYNMQSDGTCTKTIQVCPSGFTDNGTNCEKTVAYDYYDYLCSDSENEFGQIFTIIDDGGDCSKVDPDNTIMNASLSVACNNSTPPTNNCKRKEFTCNGNIVKPAYVDGEWQCSPYICNQDSQCGYGTCNSRNTSKTEIMPYSFHPIDALFRSGDACTPVQCNSNIEYSDGIAISHEVKNCVDGKTYNQSTGMCEYYEYIDKVSSTSTSLQERRYGQRVKVTGGGYLYTGVGIQLGFSYQLEDFDTGWIDTDSLPSIANYMSFRVRDDGNWVTTDYRPYNYIDTKSENGVLQVRRYGERFKSGSTYIYEGTNLNPLYGTLENFDTGWVDTTDAFRAKNNYMSFRVRESGNWVTTEYKPYNYVDYRMNTIVSYSCPSGYEDNGENCKKLIETGVDEQYTYYTYQCFNDTNEFGNSWELDSNISNTDPGCIDDTFGNCINFERETGVCKRQLFSCPLSSGTCQKNSSGNYQCSLDGCQADRFPCLFQICDLATNDKISYCEEPACPKIEGVYERDDKCFVMTCPDGSFELDGNCIEE